MSFEEVDGKLRSLANAEKAKILRGRISQKALQEDAATMLRYAIERFREGKRKRYLSGGI